MNIIIKNRNRVIDNAQIEVLKTLTGEFERKDLEEQLVNLTFNKVIIDITAIKNYYDPTSLFYFLSYFDVNKVILLLDKDDAISDSKIFLSKLVNMGIYNFTKDPKDLMYLYTNPNIYRDVAYLQNIEDDQSSNNTSAISQVSSNKKVLGVKNITDSAGSTTLIYMLKKVLSDYYSVMALEINKRDLTYFKDKDTLTVKEDEIDTVMSKYSSVDIFLLDLNKYNKEYICTDVLYLIEPTTLKLNKLSLINPKVFGELKGKKVVLNKSLLNEDEIADFEVESDLKVYYNMPPLNDKKDNSNIILPLLEKLGYVKAVETEEEDKTKKNRLFDWFFVK